MGTGAAWLYSVVATVAPQIFPMAFHMENSVAVYFEAASVITVLLLLGQVLELSAREHTSGAIQTLLNLAPMGTGTDIAIECAGVILLRGDLNGIVQATHLSRSTMRNIRQNLFFAFVYNAAGVPIAAGVLYPPSVCCCHRFSRLR